MIEFDPDTHIYKIDGRVVPSVTQVLGAMGCGNNRFYTGEGRERGNAVDTLTELYDAGKLDLDAVESHCPQYHGYVMAWIKFRAETGFETFRAQVKVANSVLGYAGMLDREGRFHPRNTNGVIVDIKTGAREWWHPLQTQGYADCMVEPHGRGCVYLDRYGDYKWSLHDDPADAAGWLNYLYAYNYRKNRGAKDD